MQSVEKPPIFVFEFPSLGLTKILQKNQWSREFNWDVLWISLNIDFIYHYTFFEITKFSKILSKFTLFSKNLSNFESKFEKNVQNFRKYFRNLHFEKSVMVDELNISQNEDGIGTDYLTKAPFQLYVHIQIQFLNLEYLWHFLDGTFVSHYQWIG